MITLDASHLFAAAATLAVALFLLAQIGGRRRFVAQRAAIAIYAGLATVAVGYVLFWWLGR